MSSQDEDEASPDHSSPGSTPESELVEAEYQTFQNEPSPEPVAVSLDSAIDDAPVHQIRFALKELARSQATAKAYLEKTFTLPIVGSNSRKRKAFDVCGHCSEEYTVSDNEKGCCNYHPGVMEPNQDHSSWDDAYEEWEYPQKEDCPEGFIWDCCDQPGDSDGCILSRHLPQSECYKRARM